MLFTFCCESNIDQDEHFFLILKQKNNMNPSDYIVGDGKNRPRRNMICVTCQNAYDRDLAGKIIENRMNPILDPMSTMIQEMTFHLPHPKPVYQSCKICNPNLPRQIPGDPLPKSKCVPECGTTFSELPMQQEMEHKMEHLVHFKGFSTCSKCTDRFTQYNTANLGEDRSYNEIKILFEEFDEQEKMSRCCLLNQVLASQHREGTFRCFEPIPLKCSSNVSDALNLRLMRGNLPIGTAEGPCGDNFSVGPLEQEQEFKPKKIDVQNCIEITKEISINHIETPPNSNSTNKKTASKARKSNRRRKSMKKKKLKR